MLEWVSHTAERVDQVAKNDPEYSALAHRRAELDSTFCALLDQLSDEDREFLLEYMDVVGNMQYRMTQLAWRYGRQHSD